ncbi:hypothetical protein E1286_21175 [Nonomuraea terrae]|uniref:Uncharacterized protein n=1 Tax=Nonomuraea terrae TaxID=2530383 RepID=A0A4R4YMY2_9ACTN|nr:hypothetical protein E1286_21175 [Nonomuraea terrae]
MGRLLPESYGPAGVFEAGAFEAGVFEAGVFEADVFEAGVGVVPQPGALPVQDVGPLAPVLQAAAAAGRTRSPVAVSVTRRPPGAIRRSASIRCRSRLRCRSATGSAGMPAYATMTAIAVPTSAGDRPPERAMRRSSDGSAIGHAVKARASCVSRTASMTNMRLIMARHRTTRHRRHRRDRRRRWS